MANTNTQSTRDGNGVLTSFNFTFEYLQESDVYVSLTVDSTQSTTELTRTTDWTFANATTIAFEPIATETVWQKTSGAPQDGVTVRIYRVTNSDSAQATFFAGSAIRAQDLNNNNRQLLYATQETVERRLDSTGGTMSGDLNMGGNKISNVADPTVGTDVVTKDYLDTFSFNPAGTGNVDFTGNITVAGTAVFSDDVTINTTTALTIPDGTQAERPTGVTGMIRFNTDISQFEGYHGGSIEWASIGGGATGGGGDTVFVETGQLISEDYTLTTGPTKAEKRNAISAGPVEIASGKVVEVPAGQSWVIV